VPDLAQIDLIARSPFNTTLKDVWEWIQNIAKGATLMTGTRLDVSGIGSYANIVPNDPLAAVAQKNLQEVGGYSGAEEPAGSGRLQDERGRAEVRARAAKDVQDGQRAEPRHDERD
jgi:aminobenzoyl-glutamate utilization protein B